MRILCSISRTALRCRSPFADDAARTLSPHNITSIQSTLCRSACTCSSPPLTSSCVPLFLRAGKEKLPQHPSVQVYKIKHLAPRGSNQAIAVRRRSISSPSHCRRIQLTHTMDDASIKVAPVCFRRRCQLPPRTPFRLHRIAQPFMRYFREIQCPAVKFQKLCFGSCLVQAQHGKTMPGRLEFLQRCGTNSLGGRIGSDLFRISLFQGQEFIRGILIC